MGLSGWRLLAVCAVVTVAVVFFGLWVVDSMSQLATTTPFSQP